MIRTKEEQYLHELIESKLAPLRNQMIEMRKLLDSEPIKNNYKSTDEAYILAKEFTDNKLKNVNTLLSSEYKLAYRAGIMHYIEDNGEVIRSNKND